MQCITYVLNEKDTIPENIVFGGFHKNPNTNAFIGIASNNDNAIAIFNTQEELCAYINTYLQDYEETFVKEEIVKAFVITEWVQWLWTQKNLEQNILEQK